MADWVGGTSELLETLVRTIGRYVLGSFKLHADDTPVPVLSPGRGTTKQGRLWTYVRDDRPAGRTDPAAVFFATAPIAKASGPREGSGLLGARAAQVLAAYTVLPLTFHSHPQWPSLIMPDQTYSRTRVKLGSRLHPATHVHKGWSILPGAGARSGSQAAEPRRKPINAASDSVVCESMFCMSRATRIDRRYPTNLSSPPPLARPLVYP